MVARYYIRSILVFQAYIYDIESLTEIKLSNGSHPSFSQKGDKVVFKSNESGNDELYTINLDGSNKKRITYSWGWEESPVFQPQL